MNKIIQLFKLNIDYSNRIFGLDLLRFFAIFFVMYLHAGRFFPKKYIEFHSFFIYDGVGVFFVLSGFLIGGILLKELDRYKVDSNLLFDFWIRRWMRTLPNYFLFLIGLLLFNFFKKDNFLFQNKIQYFFFLQNINNEPLSFFSESWSLAIEEWFYLILPLLMFFQSFFLKNIKLQLFLSILSIFLICCFYRYNLFLNEENLHAITYTVLGRLDSILFGVVGAFIYKSHEKLWIKYKLHFFTIGLFLLLYNKYTEHSDFYEYVLKSVMTSITILFFLPYFSQLKECRNKLIRKVVIFVSIISYSIYLVNMQVSDFLSGGINWSFIVNYLEAVLDIRLGIWSTLLLLNMVLFYVLTVLISILIYKYYEVPMTQLRELPFFKERFKKTLK